NIKPMLPETASRRTRDRSDRQNARRSRSRCWLTQAKRPAQLTTTLAGAIWFCPVKQRRALLKSNPPRDNWMRRRNKNVSTFWGGQNLPEKFCGRPLFQSLLMPQKTWAWGQESPSWYCLKRELEKSISR